MSAVEQLEVCRRVGAAYSAPDPHQVVGIAENVKSDVMPLNGLRHPPEGHTSGWYIWAGGEPGSDPSFFQSLHVSHVEDWRSGLYKYLGLPPGWRFQVAPDYEDIWFDSSLLDV